MTQNGTIIPSASIQNIELIRISPDPTQPRTEFDDAEIDLLTQSIEERGLKYHLRVRPSDRKGYYILLSGERRFRAVQRLKPQQVSCIIQSEPLSEAEILEEQLIDDSHTKSLSVIERARAFKRLMDIQRWSASQVADSLRVKRKRVFTVLKLLSLAPELQAKIGTRALPIQTAELLCEIEDHGKQREIAAEIEAQDISTSGAKQIVRRHLSPPRRKRRKSTTKKTFNTQRGGRVIVKSVQALDEEAVLKRLQRAEAEALRDLLKARGVEAPPAVSLLQLVELLQLLASASGTLQAEISDVVRDTGLLVLARLRILHRSDNAGVRREFVDLLNALSMPLKTVFDSLRRPVKPKSK